MLKIINNHFDVRCQMLEPANVDNNLATQLRYLLEVDVCAVRVVFFFKLVALVTCLHVLPLKFKGVTSNDENNINITYTVLVFHFITSQTIQNETDGFLFAN